MRPRTIVFWLFALGLQWTLILAEKNERTPLCIQLEEENHRFTREQANTTVGPWARGQYNEYLEWNKTAEPHDEFWHWLHRKWAPDASDTIIECRLSGTCSPVTCQFITEKYDLQDQWNAYWALESITAFHNMAYEIKRANQDVWSSVADNVGTLIAKFSDGSNIEAHKLQHDKHWKLAGYVIVGAAMLISALGFFVAAAMGVGFAVVAPIAAVISEEAVTMFASSAALFGSGAATALSLGTSLMGPKDYVSGITTTLANVQTQNHDQIVDSFDAYMRDLFNGHDSGLLHLVQNGNYVNATKVLTPEYNKQLRERWRASYISSIWNLEGTYIVMADTGNCESDSRGFKALRVCLEEEHRYVFYVFAKTIIREGTNHKALIRGPIGHANLEAFTNFTLTDVVRASLVYSKRNGYSVSTGAPEGKEDMLASFFGPASAKDGGKAHGLFNVPILYSPGGQAISSINNRHNRNYPCMAARLPWSENNDHQLRSLQSRDMKWTDNDPETMFQFMNATGFYKSCDWWGYCHGDGKNHGNHCRGDKKINWQGAFGPDQCKKIQHPFKHCKARKGHDNGFVGCERPNNNGYDKNRPGQCGGKHVMAEGFVESDTQWLNGTAIEADDMEEDEGELSDWTDGEDEGDEDQGDESRVRISQDNTTGIASKFHT